MPHDKHAFIKTDCADQPQECQLSYSVTVRAVKFQHMGDYLAISKQDECYF